MKTISAHVTGFYHSSFHAYTTEVSLNGHRWRLGLRYSKFHEFYDQLLMQDKDFHVDFPPKGTLFFTPKPEERQEQLEVFLQKVLAYYAARSFPAEVENLLCDLLKVPHHLRTYERDDDDTSTSTESGQDEPMNESMVVEKKEVKEEEHIETKVAEFKTVEQVTANKKETTDQIALTERTLEVQKELSSPLVPAEKDALATLESVQPASPVADVLHAEEQSEEAHDAPTVPLEETEVAHKQPASPVTDVLHAEEQSEEAHDAPTVPIEDTEVAHKQPASPVTDVLHAEEQSEEAHNETPTPIEDTEVAHRQPLTDVVYAVEQSEDSDSDTPVPIQDTEVVHRVLNDDTDTAASMLVHEIEALPTTPDEEVEKKTIVIETQEPEPENTSVMPSKKPVDKSTENESSSAESVFMKQTELTPRGRVSSWIVAYLPKTLLDFIRYRCMKKTNLFVLSVALMLPIVFARR